MTAIDFQPTLVGKTVKLRPLAREDFNALYLAASDPRIWELHPDSERYKRNIFEELFFDSALASRGALVIEEVDSGHIISLASVATTNGTQKKKRSLSVTDF